MSREMFTVITDPSGKIVFDSADDEGTFFVGRNEETNAMFNFCEPFTVIKDDANEEWFGIDLTSLEKRKAVLDELEELQDKSDHRYDTMHAELDDLRAARRHAPSVKVFYEFTDSYTSLRRDFEETYWNRAGDMKRLILHTLDVAIKLANLGVVNTSDPDLAGYKMYFVFSD